MSLGLKVLAPNIFVVERLLLNDGGPLHLALQNDVK